MKQLIFLLLALPLFCQAIIYDQDDAYEAFEIYDNLDFYTSNVEKITSIKPELVEKAIQATAAMIKPSKLQERNGGEILITGSKLSRFRFYSTKKYLCEEVRFIDQQSSATCSGALIGPKHILTAGHCIENDNDCSNYKWVFNYKNQPDFGEILVTSDDVYGCKRIAGRRQDGGRNIDWAIIELDREVFGREPLKTRRKSFMEYEEDGVIKKSQLKRGVPLFLVGSSFGTPMKVITNGKVAKTGLAHAFHSAIDNYFGNSGGPVINAKTGIIEGVVATLGIGARGLVDGGYDATGEKKCLKPRVVDTSKKVAESLYLQVCETTAEGIWETIRKEKIPY